MQVKYIFLAIILVPLLIAGGFVITFLTYMLIPITLAATIAFFIYAILTE